MSQGTRINKVQKKQLSEQLIDPAEIAKWEVINKYAEACGGDTSDRTVSDKRMQAVVDVNKYINGLCRNGLGNEVFAVGARFEVNNRNVFKTYELALEALEGKRKECIANGGREIPPIEDGQFTFETGGWDSTTVTWRIYQITVHDNVKGSCFVYDAVAEKLKREAEQKRRELETQKRKEAFINTLTPEQKRELGILFIGDDDDRY